MRIEKSLVYGVLMMLILSVGAAFAAEDEYIIHLSNDETKLLKLDDDAASVIVANPDYANVMVDTPRHLVIVLRRPGSTNFQVLSQNGDVILSKQIVVGANKEHYVNIRRACGNAGDTACAPVTQYYCPDGCHEVYVASAEPVQTQRDDGLNINTTDQGRSLPTVPPGE